MTSKIFFITILSLLSFNSFADSPQLLTDDSRLVAQRFLKSVNRSIDRKIAFNEATSANLGAISADPNNHDAESQAKFLAQIVVGGKTMATGVFSANTPIDVNARIHVAAEDRGQAGEVFIVAVYDNAMFMKTAEGWASWSGQLGSLKSVEPSKTLNAVENIQIASNLTLAGDFSIFTGYRVNKQLHHSKAGHNFRIYTGMVDEVTATLLQGNGIDANHQPLSSDARFMGQLHIDGQPVPVNTQASAVNVYARIHVAADKVGQIGEILSVIVYQGEELMKTPNGWVAWDGQLSTLQAISAPHALQAVEDFEIEKNLDWKGKLEILFAYRINGQVYYTEKPLMLALVGATEPATETEQNTAPVISGVPAVSITVGNAYSFIPFADDADEDSLTFNIANKPVWASFNTFTGALNGVPSASDIGTTSAIVISVSDTVETVSLSAFNLEVIQPNRMPTITGAPDTTLIAGNTYSFIPVTDDADEDSLTFSITNKPAWASFNPLTGALSGIPSVGDAGTTNGIVISVSDMIEIVNLPAFNLVVIAPLDTEDSDNHVPNISGTPMASIIAGNTYSFTPTVNDVDGDTLSFSIANKPAWASFNPFTGTLSGVPSISDAGTTSGIVISVSDTIETVSLAAFNLEVIHVIQSNDAPTITGTPAATVTTGNTYSFTPTASDADGDTLIFSIVNKPAWASFNTATGMLSGIPLPANAGTTTDIVISVSDAIATVSLAAFSLEVIHINHAPTISGASAAAITAGNAYSFTPTASDADGDTLIFSIVNKPAWASFNTATGTLSGVPSVSDAGTTAGIVISVSDAIETVSLAAFSLEVIETNRAPIITGVPKSDTHLYDTYQFVPAVTDADNDTLIFSITHKPSWAEFDTTTGVLQGIADTEGSYADIIISVSDGDLSTSLPAFSIDVLAAVEIAQQFGKATQGSTYKTGLASYVIDGDVNTANHTQCNATDNWWQLELPKPTLVSNFMIQGRLSHAGRLADAKVYLTQLPYSGVLDEGDKVATLLGVSSAQETVLDTAKLASYLIVKANDENCLHMVTVEVYGETPSTPVFAAHDLSYLIRGDSAIGEHVVTLSAVDYQGDTLIYSIDSAAFSVNSEGDVKVNSALDASPYTVTVTISDGLHFTSTELTINVTSSSAVEDALNTGDASFVTADELLVATRTEIAGLVTESSLLSALYKDEAIAYDSGKRSQLINLKGDAHKITPILRGNKGNTLAAAGTKAKSRFAAFGTAPMRHFQNGNNLGYEPQFKRLLAWLIAGEPLDMSVLDADRTLALSFTNSDTTKIKNWLTIHYANWTIIDCNNAATLAICYDSVDLIIAGWQASEADALSIRETLEGVVNQGTPVLYLHTWYEGYNDVAHTIADLFGFALPYAGNYFQEDSATWANVELMRIAISAGLGYERIDQVLAHFQQNDYALDWSFCDDDGLGDDCAYHDAFGKAGYALRNMVTLLDGSKVTLFPNAEYRLQKLLILLGDKYRQETTYPMDKVNTDDTQFFQSLFADYAVYNYRNINPAQQDMGNFSRSDFSHITAHNKTVNLTSKRSFRSTGVYALPGQTMRVTRTDTAAVKTTVFINTLRSGATHEFETNGYKRPKFLKTVSFEIKSGETIELTSPYGGPIQISFNTNDLEVAFTFENIGEHAYWSSSADDDLFTEKLDAGDFDWAEVITSGFEVHSTLEKMRESVANPKWGTAATLASATERYMSNFPHVLAGFQGPGIDVVDEIHDFAIDNSLTIETLDKVKHMNADQATCGSGCSGNPYDAYWAYSPIAHGDVHELGHGLEKSRFRFEGWEGHSITNPYSYYTKSKYNQDPASAGETACQNLPFKGVFDALQTSVGEADAVTYLQENLWADSGWSQQFMVTLQAMMHAQKMGMLDNGWHLLARLHILEREIKRAKDDWDANKASLGFSGYTIDEFNEMRKNDWMLISLSYAVSLDFSDYLTMMGIEYSAKAASQVASFGYPDVPREFFVSTPNGYCKTDTYGSFLEKSTLNIDGTTPWPE